MSDHVVLFNANLLAQELEEVVEWHRLGVHLGLSEKEIREIELNHQELARRRTAMLDKWTRKQANASWEMVIEALEKMKEQRLANKLREMYCTQQHKDDDKPIVSEKPKTGTSVMSESLADLQEAERVITVDYRRHAVAREIDNLHDKHFELVKKTEDAVESAKPSSHDLKRFSKHYMTNEVASVEELFDHVEPYFLDYALLEKIVKFLLERDHSVVSELDDYIRELEEFKSSITLKQFMESIETAQQPPTATETSKMCTVTLKLVGGWLEKTISDLDKLLKVVFQDKASVLSHLRISPGSVIITYLTPLSEVDGLITVALDQVPFMLQVGVCELMIGDKVVTSTQSDTSDFSFESSLIKAVEDNNIDVLSFLVDINTSSDAVDDYGQTALFYGSFYGRSKAVSLLLKANANPHLHNDDGATPLLMASQNGHTDIVDLLLKANANPNLHIDNGATPLFKASQEGHTDIVDLLLKANANPNLHRDNGATPLFMASLKGHTDIVSLLLKANANLNLHRDDDGATPLFVASQEGHADIVNLLLKANANPDLHRDDGATPLFMASHEGHTDIVSLLLKANAKPNLHTDDDGATPLFVASQEGYADIVNLLLKANANPNLPKDNGVTPLFMASQEGHTDIVSLLLKANANPNLHRDDDGVTPLMFACFFTHPEVVQLLLASEADPNLLNSDGMSALMFGCHVGCLESVELLLMYGADPSPQGPGGLTALDIAAYKGHKDIVDLIHAVELSQSSSISPVLTASEIAANVDNETLTILNKAIEKMLVNKTESLISTRYKMLGKSLPSKNTVIDSV